MPQLQWLGDIKKETGGGYLAKALGGGISKGFETYVGTREKRIEQAEEKRRWEEEMELKRGELKYKMANLEQSKLMELVSTTNKIISFVDKDRRAEMLDDPEIQAVYDAAGVPLPRAEVEESPWAGTSWWDRAHAAVTPGATKMEKERGGLRPGGVFDIPKTRTRPPTPRSRLLPALEGKEAVKGRDTAERLAAKAILLKKGYSEKEVEAMLGGV